MAGLSGSFDNGLANVGYPSVTFTAARTTGCI